MAVDLDAGVVRAPLLLVGQVLELLRVVGSFSLSSTSPKRLARRRTRCRRCGSVSFRLRGKAARSRRCPGGDPVPGPMHGGGPASNQSTARTTRVSTRSSSSSGTRCGQPRMLSLRCGTRQRHATATGRRERHGLAVFCGARLPDGSTTSSTARPSRRAEVEVAADDQRDRHHESAGCRWTARSAWPSASRRARSGTCGTTSGMVATRPLSLARPTSSQGGCWCRGRRPAVSPAS